MQPAAININMEQIKPFAVGFAKENIENTIADIEARTAIIENALHAPTQSWTNGYA